MICMMTALTIESILVFDMISIITEIYMSNAMDMDIQLFGPLLYRGLGLVLGIILLVYGMFLYKKYKQ